MMNNSLSFHILEIFSSNFTTFSLMFTILFQFWFKELLRGNEFKLLQFIQYSIFLMMIFIFIGKNKMDPIMFNFRVLYVLTQLCGLTVVILMAFWLSVYLGGFAGTADPAHEFSWHPLLMTIGLIFLYGNGK